LKLLHLQSVFTKLGIWQGCETFRPCRTLLSDAAP